MLFFFLVVLVFFCLGLLRFVGFRVYRRLGVLGLLNFRCMATGQDILQAIS